MDTREILTRFKGGTLRREHAVALLAGTSPAVAPPVVALPVVALPVAADREPPPGPVPVPGTGVGVGDGAGVPCAVVGIQGRFPQAGDLEAFWRNGLQGRIAEAALPGGRRSACAGWRGHFLDGVEEFDPDLFGLSAREAAGLDLQERLLAQSAWQTLESAGYAGARLERLTAPDGTARSVGVYAALGPAGGALPPAGHRHTAPPASRPGPAARLSRLLDLRGPSLSVDSGDSSFLTALHLALGALRAGECAAALVGAVELRLHPACQRPGAGEGVAAVLLKPLAAARADGDRVHAVIRSSAVGHPGRAALGPQHGRLVGRALAAAGLRPWARARSPRTAGPQGPDRRRAVGGAGRRPGGCGGRSGGESPDGGGAGGRCRGGDRGGGPGPRRGAAAPRRAAGRPGPPRARRLGAGPPRRRHRAAPQGAGQRARTRSPRSPRSSRRPHGRRRRRRPRRRSGRGGHCGRPGRHGGRGWRGRWGGCGCGAGRGGGACRPPRPGPYGPAAGHASRGTGAAVRRDARAPGGHRRAGSRPACPTAAAGTAPRRPRISPHSRTNCAWGGRCCAAVWR
ncbi:polyketide synthase [Streptomyces mirabilis]|uniref:beta-ketoacyl [acyl carrier protein] synthase domain-containing protein n=1 Tax=Streptomyces mirabilis TaxID=68239 RepID=UPI002E3126D6|nr:polyketide synthase [Streptomyces mirabilis]